MTSCKKDMGAIGETLLGHHSEADRNSKDTGSEGQERPGQGQELDSA